MQNTDYELGWRSIAIIVRNDTSYDELESGTARSGLMSAAHEDNQTLSWDAGQSDAIREYLETR